MPVSLEKLPPLLSHFCCICIGLLLSYYISSETVSESDFLPKKIYLSFSEYSFKKDLSSTLPGRKILFGKTESKNSLCLFKDLHAVVVQNEPFLVAAFPLKSAGKISELLKEKNKTKLKIIPDSTHSFNFCSHTEIEYGYSE